MREPYSFSTFDPVRGEIMSPGTSKDGRRYYAVDFVEVDRGCSDIYVGPDHNEARDAAIFGSDKGALPVLDFTADVPVPAARRGGAFLGR